MEWSESALLVATHNISSRPNRKLHSGTGKAHVAAHNDQISTFVGRRSVQ